MYIYFQLATNSDNILLMSKSEKGARFNGK